MNDRLRFLLNRLTELLWVRPLVVCVLSIAAAFLARLADGTELLHWVPEISSGSISKLLSIIASSMLVIATFAVGSLVSAYASASTNATPRSFPLVIADDVSQNALSTFVGAFIFSIVALVAVENGYYGKAGLFALFVLTGLVFAVVIVTFVRWLDRIARLGRLGSTIEKVEAATREALARRRGARNLGGIPPGADEEEGQAVYSQRIGYVQRVDVEALQACAVKCEARITVAALPGTFVTPDRSLARVRRDSGGSAALDPEPIAAAFRVGDDRKFDEDPRFGLVVLAQIGSRALSPAVNDPGTAIDLIGTFVRLLMLWCQPFVKDDEKPVKFDRVAVPELAIDDLCDDAFTALARDGAGTVEVAVRLQKALRSLAAAGYPALQVAARRHGRLALARAEQALRLPEDLEAVRKGAGFISRGTDREA